MQLGLFKELRQPVAMADGLGVDGMPVNWEAYPDLGITLEPEFVDVSEEQLRDLARRITE